MLSTLAQKSQDKMKPFLRDSFPAILEGIKVPNKVMSGYVDDCIFRMIGDTSFKSGIGVLAQELRDNKSKLVREKCLVRFFFLLVFTNLHFPFATGLC